jgi:hypothetical protein
MAGCGPVRNRIFKLKTIRYGGLSDPADETRKGRSGRMKRQDSG